MYHFASFHATIARKRGDFLETIYLTVQEICGDYAVLVSDGGETRQTAIFLLPEGITDGTRLKFENFSYEIIE